MYNFPYEYHLQPLPVKTACKPFKAATTQEQLAIAPYATLNMFYNKTGTEKDLHLWNFTQIEGADRSDNGNYFHDLKIIF